MKKRIFSAVLAILCLPNITAAAMIGPTDNFAQNSMDSFDMTSMYDVGDYTMDQFYNNADDLYTVDALNDMNDILFFGIDVDIYVSDTISNGDASIYLPEYETAEPAITDDGIWSSGMNDFFYDTDITDNSLVTIDPVDISMLPEDISIDLVFIEPVELITADIIFDPIIQEMQFNLFEESEEDPDGPFWDFTQYYESVEEANSIGQSSTIENAPLMDDSIYLDMMTADQETSAALDYNMMESMMMEQNALAAQEALEQAYQQAIEEAMLEAMKQEMAEQQGEATVSEDTSGDSGSYQEKTSEDYAAEFEKYLKEYYVSLEN